MTIIRLYGAASEYIPPKMGAEMALEAALCCGEMLILLRSSKNSDNGYTRLGTFRR